MAKQKKIKVIPDEVKKVVNKVKPRNFGADSPAQKNDRTRHSLSHYTNGD